MTGKATIKSVDQRVRKAMLIHEEYTTALNNWISFQRKNASEVAFWNAVKDTLKIAKQSSNGLDPRKLYASLGLDKSKAESSIYETLELDSKPVHPSGATGSFENDFIDFGRKVVSRQERIKRAVLRLTNYVVTGNEEESYREFLFDTFIPPTSSYTGFVDSEWDSTDWNPMDNPFFAGLYEDSYAENITALQKITERLSETKAGMDFLATLFRWRERAIIDPYAIVNPSLLSELEGDNQEFQAVHLKSQAEYDAVFRTDGMFKSADVADRFADLVYQLMPGFAYVSKANSDSLTRTYPFIGGAIEKLVTDEDLRALQPSWEDTIQAVRESEGGWKREDTEKVVRVFVDGLDKIKKDVLKKRVRSRSMRQIAVLKLLSHGYDFIKKMKDGVTGNTTIKEFGEFSMSLLTLGGDLELMERFFDRNMIELSRRKRYKMGGLRPKIGVPTYRLGRFLAKIGPVLSVISVGLDVHSAYEDWSSGDVDTLYGHTPLVFGGISLLVAEGLTIAGTGPVGWCVAAGIGLILLGTYLLSLTKDVPVEVVLKQSYYGTEWESQTTRNADPSKASFRFKYPSLHPRAGEVNFNRQLSELISLSRPMNATHVGYDKDERIDGTDYRTGTIVLEPGESYGPSWKSEITTDGYLLVVPILPSTVSDDNASLSPYFPTPLLDPPPIHELRIGDANAGVPPSRETRSNVPLWSNRSDLNFKATSTPPGTPPGRDRGVSEWTGQIWAETEAAADYIFGFELGDLEDRDTAWVELVYIPSSLYQQIDEEEFLGWETENWALVTRERVEIDITLLL